MFELLDSINHWHWLAFGLALLAVELLGTAGYFLWLGISALLVGVIFLALPMSWQLQWVCFGVFSLITTWIWWRRQYKIDVKNDKSRDLNQKHKQLIGEIVTLTEDLPIEGGRIKLYDTTWKAKGSESISKGTEVTIIDIQGITLIVKKIRSV
ncbi:NfeD family protein [uncultured Vibrio sp.]|uniref:NfeD family protein n=1 Tax=uncultured Vibrio sp. TaxID=114054 RepID=UPI0009189BD3|nr:NfeD family protein [uncultured Vibrio sp.]OIQ26092.1 MAG: hypothetical protein BM561_03765 [Vibrio sp. MedPE-SWchi]